VGFWGFGCEESTVNSHDEFTVATSLRSKSRGPEDPRYALLAQSQTSKSRCLRHPRAIRADRLVGVHGVRPASAETGWRAVLSARDVPRSASTVALRYPLLSAKSSDKWNTRLRFEPRE
jgi:hypothetical protein